MRRLTAVLGILLAGISLTAVVAQAAHAEDDPGQNQQGTPPTIIVSPGNLVAGQPGTVAVSLVGGDVPAGDMELPIIISLTVDNGVIQAQDGTSGREGKVIGPYGTVRSGVTFNLTPEREGPISLRVVASPADRPQDGISASATATVAPGAPPSPSPSPSPEPATPSAAPQPTAVAASPPAPAPEPTPSIEPRAAKAPDLPAYRALDEPEQVVDTTVTAVAVIGIIGVGAAAG